MEMCCYICGDLYWDDSGDPVCSMHCKREYDIVQAEIEEFENRMAMEEE